MVVQSASRVRAAALRSSAFSLAKAEDLALKGISAEVWRDKVVGSKFHSIPSVDTVVEGFSHHLRRYAAPGATRHLENSDFGDMLHLAYLPYVDAFRCDANASQIAQALAKRLGVRLLTRLQELDTILEGAASPRS